MAVHSNSSQGKPKFSAGLITLLVTGAWIVVFGLVLSHGLDGIHQHDRALAQMQSK